MYHLERSSNGKMKEFKVENQRYPEIKLRADQRFKGWEKGQSPKEISPKFF